MVTERPEIAYINLLVLQGLTFSKCVLNCFPIKGREACSLFRRGLPLVGALHISEPGFPKGPLSKTPGRPHGSQAQGSDTEPAAQPRTGSLPSWSTGASTRQTTRRRQPSDPRAPVSLQPHAGPQANLMDDQHKGGLCLRAPSRGLSTPGPVIASL